MNFKKFADLMMRVGFREKDPIAPVFILNQKDLDSNVFREGYSKVPGLYRVMSLWEQDNEVAFLAYETGNPSKPYPFSKKEVNYLAKKNKFRNN